MTAICGDGPFSRQYLHEKIFCRPNLPGIRESANTSAEHMASFVGRAFSMISAKADGGGTTVKRSTVGPILPGIQESANTSAEHMASFVGRAFSMESARADGGGTTVKRSTVGPNLPGIRDAQRPEIRIRHHGFSNAGHDSPTMGYVWPGKLLTAGILFMENARPAEEFLGWKSRRRSQQGDA